MILPQIGSLELSSDVLSFQRKLESPLSPPTALSFQRKLEPPDP